MIQIIKNQFHLHFSNLIILIINILTHLTILNFSFASTSNYSCQNLFQIKKSNLTSIKNTEQAFNQLLKAIEEEVDIQKKSNLINKLIKTWQELRDHLSKNEQEILNHKIHQFRFQKDLKNRHQLENQKNDNNVRILRINLLNDVTGFTVTHDLKLGDIVYMTHIRDKYAWMEILDEDYKPSKIDFNKVRILDFNTNQSLVENIETGMQSFVSNHQILPFKTDQQVQQTYVIRKAELVSLNFRDSISNEIHFGQLMSINIHGLDMRAYSNLRDSESLQAFKNDKDYFNFKNQTQLSIDLKKLRELTDLLISEKYLITIEDFISYTDFFIEVKKSRTKLKQHNLYFYDFNQVPFYHQPNVKNILSTKLSDLLYQTKNDMTSLDIFDAAFFAMMSSALLFKTPEQSNYLFKDFLIRYEQFILPYYHQLLKSQFGKNYIHQLNTFVRNMRQGLLPTEMTIDQIINEIQLKQRELK